MDPFTTHSGDSREAVTADSKPDVGTHHENELARHSEIVQRLTALETIAANTEKDEKRKRENRAIPIPAIIAGIGVLVAVASLIVAVFAVINADPGLPQDSSLLLNPDYF